MLPQLRPAMLGGALLVGLHLLAEFGALQMLRFPTFTTAIYDQYRSTFNGPAADHAGQRARAAAAWCLLLLELRLRGHRRYARVGGGVAREPARAGRARPVRRAGARCAWPRSSAWRWACRWAAWSTGCCVGTSTAFPVGELVSTTVTTLGLGLVGAALTVAAGPAGRVAVGPPPQPARHRCSSAAPTSATRCRASSSRWRWSPCRSAACRPLYQTIAAAARGLRDPVPAAGHGEPARRARAGAAGARRRGARARRRPGWRRSGG